MHRRRSIHRLTEPNFVIVPGGGTAVFDRSTLSLSLWLKAEYTASPWVGSASAGSSSGRDFSEATNPPGTSTLNGLSIADFDGTNDILGGGGLTRGDIYAAASYSGWALVNADIISTDNPTVYDNDCIFSTQPSAYWILFLRSSGVVGIRHIDAGEIIATATFTAASWQLVQWHFNGTNLRLRVNSGAWTNQAAGNLDAGGAGSFLALGTNYAGAQFLDGKVAEIATSDQNFSDAQFDDIKASINSDYALSL